MENTKAHAKELRKNLTDAERKLWGRLRNRQLEGYKFRRQQPIGKYLVDFVCFEKKLLIELDGGQHSESEQVEYDSNRTRWLESRGYRVLRFWNHEVLDESEFESVKEVIWRELGSFYPSPSPSPSRGEGENPCPARDRRVVGDDKPKPSRGEGIDFLKLSLITLIILFSNLLLFSMPVSSQTTPIPPIALQNVIWEPANEPYNGYIRSLLTTPAGNIFAGTDGGIFRSVDTGETWTEVNRGLSGLTSPIVRALAVSGSTLFAGTDEGLFRSIDDGDNWTLVSPNLRAVIQALASSRFSIFAGTDDRGVFRSTDNGNSWTQVNSGLTNPTVYALARFRGLLFAGTNGGVFRSLDNGDNWTSVNSGLTNTIVYSLAISGSGKTVLAGTAGGVFRSTDDGQTWTQVGKGLITAKVLSLAILRDIPATIFAGTEGQGIFRSTDDGQTWNRANTGLTNPVIPALVGAKHSENASPLQSTVFAGTDGNGIFRSADNGQTWAAINLGLTNVNVLSLAASRKFPSIIFASTDGGGVFRSLDNGNRWNPVNAGLTHTVVSALALAEPGSSPNIAAIFAGANGGGVFRSLDNGDSWIQVNKGLLNPNVLALALAETSATTVAIFAGTNGGGVFRSLDNGDNWTPVNKGLSHMAVSALTLASKSLFAGTDGGGVFRSLDNGDNWTPVNIGLTNLAVNALASIETNLFAGTNGGGVFRSTDNGNRWTPVNSGLTSSTVNVLATSGVDIFAGTNSGGVFRSTNNGEAWTQVNESLDRGLTHIIISSLASSGASVFAGVTGGKVFRASIKVISDPPSIISLSPQRLSQGLSGQKISISGANFQPEAKIIFSGSGISVSAVSFDRSTQLTADVNLDPNADLGLRDMILINPDGGSFKKTKAFTVISQPTVSSLDPIFMEPGSENKSLVILGEKFQLGATVAFSGKGISIKSVDFKSSNQLLVNLSITSDAELGLGDLILTNPDGGVTKTKAFKVINLPTITSLSPAFMTLAEGTEGKDIIISGDKFQSGATLTFSGSGIAVEGVVFENPTQLTVNVLFDSNVELGFRDLTLTNPDGGQATKTKAFKVIGDLDIPDITSLSPDSMTLAEGTEGKGIIISGDKFQSGATLTFSGAGIAVDKVAFDNPTQLTAAIRIDPKAELGLRDLTLTNPDGGSVKKVAAFSLISSPSISALNPGFAPQGVENRIINILGDKFQFESAVAFSGSGISVNSVTFDSETQLMANISIVAEAQLGFRDITVTNPDGGKVAKSQAFNVVMPPVIKALSPASLFQGAENKSLIIAGDNFQKEAKVAFSGSGVVVNSVTFDSAAQLTASLSLEPQAEAGFRDLIVTNPDGGEAAKTQAFTVAAIPLITALSPASLAQDSINKTITISGNSFQKGAKVAFSGDGIRLGLATVESEAQLSFNVNIAANAEAGSRDVTVTNPDGGSFTKTKAFTVISAPVIIILNPAFSPQGLENKLIQILGDNFQKGAKVAFGGSGVAVNSVAFDSAKQLTVDINIAPNADLGFRDITVTNPDGSSFTKSEALKVALAPLITSISPNVMAQGLENKSLTIAGDNFQKGAVVVFSGSGINVNSISYDSATQLTVVISISTKAEAGLRDIAIINPDGVSRSKSGAFSVIQSVAFANVSITAFPTPPIADGKSTAIIRFNLKDANDKPISGKKLELTISGSGHLLTPPQPIPTDAGGQTRVALTSTKAETKTITASVEGVSFSTEVTFAPDVVSATKSTVSAISPVAADSLSGSTATLVLKDQHENLISHRNFKVSVSIEPSDGVSIIPASSFTKVTDANGSLNFAVKSTKAELKTLKVKVAVSVSEATASGAAVSPATATTTAATVAETALQPPEAPAIAIIDSVALQSAPTIEFKAGAPEVIIVTSDKAETLTGQAVKIKATVEDKYKNPIKDAKLTISALFESGATEIISPVINHNDGSYSAAYQPKTPGKISLKATATDSNKFGVATISVSHINQPPTAIKLSNSTISEDSLNDAEVGVLTTVDADLGLNVGEAHSYQLKLKEDAGGRFKIVDDRILVAKSWLLDFETAKSHQITVLSADRGNLTIEQAFNITISDASETPISITSIVPAYGLISGGSSVEIRGENFASGVAVFIGEKLAEVAVFTPTQLRVSLPPGKLGAAEVKVINPGNNFALIPEGFTYVTNPAVNRIAPSGGALSGGAEVKIEGEHFSPNLKLTFGGVEATEVKRISATEILAKTPPLKPIDPKASLSSVAVDVIATNLDTGLTGTLLQGFRYLPAPVATKIQPAEGAVAGGSEVLITGEHFSLQTEPKTKVFIGDKEATGVVILSETEIRAQTPAALAGVAEVVVTTPGGRSKPLAGGFTYTSQLILRAISPKEGPTSGSTLINLKGENFEKGLSVEIGGLKATEVVFRSKTEVLAKTPAAKDELSRASVEVKVQNPDGKTAELKAAFTYVPPPRITKVTPNQAPSNALISITGQNFDPKATVSIGQKKVNIIDIIKVSPTEIQLKTPVSEAGVVDITVKNQDGQMDTLAKGFSYTKSILFEVVAGKAFEKELLAADGKPLGKLSIEIPPGNLPSEAAGKPIEISIEAFEVADAAKLADLADKLKAQGLELKAGQVVGNVVYEIEVKTETGVAVTEFREPTIIRIPYDPKLRPIPNVLLVSNVKSKKFEPILTVVRDDLEPPVLIGTLNHLSFVTAGLNKAPIAITPSPVLVAGTPTKIRLTGSDPDGDALSFSISELPSGGSLHEGTNLIFSAPYPLSSNEVTYTPKAEYFGKDSFKFQVFDGAASSASVAVEIQVSLLAPKLTAITPNRGSSLGGTQVRLKGENFVSGVTVTIGNQKASSVVVVSASEIQAAIPAYSTPASPASPASLAGTKADVVVTNPDGKSATLSAGFTFYPPPKITAISPKSGPMLGGAKVSISGANFIVGEGAEVRFGTTLATEATVVSETQITAKTPVGAPGTVDVSVTTVGGASALTAGFTYIPSPLILSLSSTRLPKGGGRLTITGENFAADATVSIGGKAATEVNVSETQITLTAPAAAEGEGTIEADLVVTNPDGQAATLTGGVVYVTDPIVSRVDPVKGAIAGGTVATLFGANFVKGTSVTFGGVAAQVKTVSEKGDMMTVVIPPASPPKEALFSDSFSVEVMVKNPDGKLFTLLGGFTYLAPPLVFAIEPATGSVAGGTPIAIIGSNFKNGAVVRLGEAIATEAEALSSTQTTAITPTPKIPEGTKPGTVTVDVIVINPDGQEGRLTAGFTYLILPPIITSMIPTFGSVSGGAVVTLRGENFNEQTTISLGGQAAVEVNFISSTQLSFKTPPNKTKKAEAVDIIVANPDGDGQATTLSAGFNYVTTPIITSVFPNKGSVEGDTPIRINGANFLNGASVIMVSTDGKKNATATEIKVVTEAELTAKIPPFEVGTVDVVVKNPDGSQWTLIGGFTYLEPPEVRFITPDTVPTIGGTAITIEGSNFKAGAELQIGEQLAENVEVLSDVKITAITKASNPGTFDAIVINPNGLKGILKGGLRYLISPPIITAIAPNKGSTVGGISISLRGENFISGATVKLGGQQLSAEAVNVLSATQISFVLPASPAGVLGEVDLTVANPDGQSVSLKGGFVYVALPPQVNVILPDSGSTTGGTFISIFGENFAMGATLSIGGISATQVAISPTKISAETPPGVEGKADITVTNPDGGSKTLKASFNYIDTALEQKRKAEAETKSLEAEKKKAEAEIKALEAERKQAEAEGETEEVKKIEAAIKKAEAEVKKLEATKKSAEAEVKRLEATPPPVITLVDTDNQAIAGSPKLIKAKIFQPLTAASDLSALFALGSPIRSINAKLFFMSGGKSFSVMEMTPMGAGAENIFVGSIPASAITLSGAAYYIKATDFLGQSSFFPAEAATNPKKAIALDVVGDITGPEVESNGSFTKTEFPAWQTKADWSMVSFPFELPNDDPKAIFDQLGKVEEDWQLYRYEGGADLARAIALKRPEHLKGDIEKFHSIQRGNAAWIYSAKGGSITIKGARATNPLAPFPIRVYSGINQIGNPFRFSRFWNSETVKFSTKADGSDAVDILTAAAANQLSPVLYLKEAGSGSYLKLSADPNMTGSDFVSFPGKFEAWKGYLFLAKRDGYLWVNPTTAGPTTGMPSAAPIYAQIQRNRSLTMVMVKVARTLLLQNYPNPFNPETWIPYQLSEAAEVKIRIFDVSGRLIRSLNLGRKEMGLYLSKERSAYWDGRNESRERVSSGVYLYELTTGSFRAVKKMAVLK